MTSWTDGQWREAREKIRAADTKDKAQRTTAPAAKGT
jgi:hypothetical protein